MIAHADAKRLLAALEGDPDALQTLARYIEEQASLDHWTNDDVARASARAERSASRAEQQFATVCDRFRAVESRFEEIEYQQRLLHRLVEELAVIVTEKSPDDHEDHRGRS